MSAQIKETEKGCRSVRVRKGSSCSAVIATLLCVDGLEGGLEVEAGSSPGLAAIELLPCSFTQQERARVLIKVCPGFRTWPSLKYHGPDFGPFKSGSFVLGRPCQLSGVSPGLEMSSLRLGELRQ